MIASPRTTKRRNSACYKESVRCRPRRPAPVEVVVKNYSLTHLSDRALDRGLPEVAARDRVGFATLLGWIGEFDERRRYLPAGFPSMSLYCVNRLRLTEESAHKRIHAARAARKFPAIYALVEQGRLT